MPVNMSRDETFYMNLVTIQVEDTLFRVPRQFLETQSRVFQDLFTIPVSENAEGSSDSNPIHLQGIRKEDFKRFLEILYLGIVERMVEPPPNFEEWIPIVKLAQMWECDRIHKYAIEKMPYQRIPKSPAEKVALALRYDITPWLLPGLQELARRKEPIGLEDVNILGLDVALKVAAVRESLAVSRSGFISNVLPGAFGSSNYACTCSLVSGARDAQAVDFTFSIQRIFGFHLTLDHHHKPSSFGGIR